MQLTTAFDIAFAVGIVVAVCVLAGTALRSLPRAVLVGASVVELTAVLAGWIAFALATKHDTELAVAAAGLSVCAVVAASTELLRRALERTAAMDAHLAEAQERLRALVDREAAERAAELERTLARARAD